jgi:predicted nucleotidyltransferase
MAPLDVLLSKAEQRLANAVLTNPEREFGTLELLQKMGSSRGAGSAVLKRWVDSGLLRERRVGNQRRLSANARFLLFPELRRMVLKTVGVVEPLAIALGPIASRLTDAFVFGSVAAGTDTSHSDIDLAVVGDVDLFLVSPLLDAVQEELGRAVHVNVYGEREWLDATDPVIEGIRQGPRMDVMEALRGKTG